MASVKITKQNFEQEVMQSDKPVLLDFWASYCAPCRMLAPLIEEIADEVEDVKICKVNVEEENELALRYHVMHIPTLVVVKNGETVESVTGGLPKQEILKLIGK